MNQTVSIASVIFTLAAIGALIVFFLLVRAFYLSCESARRAVEAAITAVGRSTEAIAQSTEAMNLVAATLKPACDALQGNMAMVPQLLESIAKIGNAQLEMLQQQQRYMVSQQKANTSDGHPSRQRDQGSADAEYEVMQLIRSGMSREEAMMSLNGANEGSVWGSQGGILSGWGGGR